MKGKVITAIKIEKADNVVVLLSDRNAGDDIVYEDITGTVSFPSLEKIPIYFKAADADIAEGESIIKYGEVIGTALQDIKRGECVHTHNVGSRNCCV